ncbi:hypothetical protein IWW38_000379 [Coemansia aciculifera]|uniref:Uncharacterized protein n=1 Tax=Coemansia aciculifera TaxID=417176 RepID=A0ACC1M9F1_9FUNG|nr:hypothetical protein IWW38_000379 [Coemansia aciculifera]
MDGADAKFVELIDQAYAYMGSFLHFGMDIRPRVTWASVAGGEFIAEWRVTDDCISPETGCIDEGWLGTVTDNTTAMLIGSLQPTTRSVSTSISVQGLSPISPGTAIEIYCKLSSPHTKQPHATAIFRDKADRSKVYAVGSHTKFFKAGLVHT